MLRKRINRVRREFAYEGQEVESFETSMIVVRQIAPPFDVELFAEGHPPTGMREWTDISVIQLWSSETNQPKLLGMLLEGTSLTIRFLNPVLAERDGNKILIKPILDY